MVQFWRPGKKNVVIKFNSQKAKEKRADGFLSWELIKKLALAINSGLPLAHSHALVGVSLPMLRKWMLNGYRVQRWLDENLDWPAATQNFDKLCYELVNAIDEAHCDMVFRYVKKVNGAAKHNWRAATWMLEKRTAEFGRAGAASSSDENDDPAEPAPIVRVYLPANGREPTPVNPPSRRGEGSPRDSED